MVVTKIESTEQFDQTLKDADNKLVVIDFYADWCGPCKRIAPILEAISDAKQDSIVVIKVNVDDNEELVARFTIKVMPTFIFIRRGEKIDELVGASENNLKELIDKYSS